MLLPILWCCLECRHARSHTGVKGPFGWRTKPAGHNRRGAAHSRAPPRPRLRAPRGPGSRLPAPGSLAGEPVSFLSWAEHTHPAELPTPSRPFPEGFSQGSYACLAEEHAGSICVWSQWGGAAGLTQRGVRGKGSGRFTEPGQPGGRSGGCVRGADLVGSDLLCWVGFLPGRLSHSSCSRSSAVLTWENMLISTVSWGAKGVQRERGVRISRAHAPRTSEGLATVMCGPLGFYMRTVGQQRDTACPSPQGPSLTGALPQHTSP